MRNLMGNSFWHRATLFSLAVTAALSVAVQAASLSNGSRNNRILLKNRQFVPGEVEQLSTSAVTGHVIIQLEEYLDGAALDALVSQEVEILEWIPQNAVMAYVPENVQVESIAGVRWAGKLLPSDKISAYLNHSLTKGFIIVEVFPDVGDELARAVIAAAQGEVIENYYLGPNTYLVQADDNVVNELSFSDEVSWIRAASDAVINGELVHSCPNPAAAFGLLVANYSTHGSGWDGSGRGPASLRYHFVNGTDDISGEESEIRRALDEWAKYAQITWTEIFQRDQSRCVDIMWATGDHGDGAPFDGPGTNGYNILAHAAFPSPPNPEPGAGDLHFDDYENWTANCSTGINLFSVALHELGHALGLGHSDDPVAIMYANYSGCYSGLRRDDINGIQSIYAARTLWTYRDIGTSGGSMRESGGEIAITADGWDIWDNSDGFGFAYQQLSGNGQVVARVTNVGTGSDAWCKAGVMIRERLTGTSKHAMTVITGGEGGGAAFQWRQSTAGLSDSSHFPPQFVSPPYWVKIMRRGDSFSGFLSPDGATWTQQGSTLTIPMAENVYAGLCVTSHAAGELRTCRFDNLQGNLQRGKTVVFEDRFESANLNQNNWLIVDGATGSKLGRSEPSREYSLRLNGNPSGGDVVESRSIDLSSHSGALFSYYYEQTGDGASPGNGDDLFVEYWNGSSWVEVNRHLGREFDMDVYKLIVVDLPVDALHADFKLRLRSIGTPDSTYARDDWFVDDVRIEGWDGCAVIFEDNFVRGDHSSTNWQWMEGEADSSRGINPPSPPYALNLNAWDKVRSKKIDLSSYSSATLSYHYEQTGSGESPDPDNDLIISYWMAGGGTRELRRHNGSGPDMTEFDKVTVSLPPEALHSNFKLIIESAGDLYWYWDEYDDWLVDDVMIEVCR